METQARPGSWREPHRVLVVDDDELIRAILADLLRREGLEVVTASSAREALTRAVEAPLSLALLDVMMPGVDGLSLCRSLKADPRTADVPVVLVTARADPMHIDEGVAAGAADYVKKPFDRDELRFRVRTHIRLHELARRERRARLELGAISDAVSDAILVLDAEGRILEWNTAAGALFGYSRQAAVGRHFLSTLVPPRLRAEYGALLANLLDGREQSLVGEFTSWSRDGELPIEASLSSVRTEHGLQILAIARDIRARVRAEEALRSSAAELRNALDTLPAGIALVGTDHRVRWVNRTAVTMLGASDVGELVGRACSDVCVTPSAEGPGPTPRAEQQLRRADGSQLTVLTSAVPVRFEGEDVVLESFIDITPLKQLEAELAHTRKLEAVGQLAAGIAHEINTPTQFVGDSIYFLMEAFGAFDRLIEQWHRARAALGVYPEHMELLAQMAAAEAELDLTFLAEQVPPAFARCLEGITRITEIVSAMKEFAHPDQREQSPADLNRALTHTLVIARNEYKYVADVETDLGELPLVTCHLGDLNQVFLNLIVNAAHAIGEVVGATGERGRITIRTEVVGDWVKLELADTGAGIPVELQRRVFEPFFTTKPVGKGTGQGLTIARAIVVDRHGGKLSFRSTPGAGTTFVVELPVGGSRKGSDP